MRRLPAVACATLLVSATLVAIASSGGAGATPDPVLAAFAASAAPGHSWSPGPEAYGDALVRDVPVRMSDGVVLRANVSYPTDPATGAQAAGPFPTLLTMTPYGKDTTGTAGLGTDPYFVHRGYIDVVVDVRGTGVSGGTFDLFDPKQAQDGVRLVNWAATLPHADGKVGMHGASYLGIDQMLTAGLVGKNSPLKAIFPVVSANDVYRDTAFMGGIPDGSFDVAYLGALLPVINLLDPVVNALSDGKNLVNDLQTLLAHGLDALNYNALFLAQAYLGGANSYDNAYWHAKAPQNVLQKIVDNGIPAYLVGGEYDLFQRGEPINFAGLQNAWSGRPVTAPMLAGQQTTGRYQLLDGPFTHLEGGGGGSLGGPDLKPLQLEWFDTWLKGMDTGMASTPTPLHYYDLGTGTYSETTTYPIAGATPTTYYFGAGRTGSAPSHNDGSLSTTKPTVASGSDSMLWSPLSGTVCARSQDQWTMGAVSLLASKAPTVVPCIDDDRPAQLGPTALTYTTTPMSTPTTIAGPITTTVYATANTRDTEWVVDVEDVAPDGTSKPLTQGALLGSFRRLDSARTWQVDGKIVMPYHDYTPLTSTPVVPGAVTAYQIEVFPTYSTIAAGHRIRVTLNTTDFPHLMPTPQQILNLVGGSYSVLRTAGAPSSVTIPLLAH